MLYIAREESEPEFKTVHRHVVLREFCEKPVLGSSYETGQTNEITHENMTKNRDYRTTKQSIDVDAGCSFYITNDNPAKVDFSVFTQQMMLRSRARRKRYHLSQTSVTRTQMVHKKMRVAALSALHMRSLPRSVWNRWLSMSPSRIKTKKLSRRNGVKSFRYMLSSRNIAQPFWRCQRNQEHVTRTFPHYKNLRWSHRSDSQQCKTAFLRPLPGRTYRVAICRYWDSLNNGQECHGLGYYRVGVVNCICPEEIRRNSFLHRLSKIERYHYPRRVVPPLNGQAYQ